MRSIKELIRRSFDPEACFNFQSTICHPEEPIIQGGLISERGGILIFDKARCSPARVDF